MPKFIATAEFDSQEINRNNSSELVNPGDEVEIDDQDTVDRLTANGWIKSADAPAAVEPEPAPASEPAPAPTGLTTQSLKGDDDKDPVPA